MDVAIVKYNAGNIYSVVNAMKRLGISPILTDDAETLRKADRVLFPGQGQAREAMLYLKAHGLDETIKSLTQPVLGICVGQQLLCRHSEEGDVDCIGTPFCITVDHDTPNDHKVTLRYRDTMKQERVAISELRGIIEDRVSITSVLKKLGAEIKDF